MEENILDLVKEAESKWTQPGSQHCGKCRECAKVLLQPHKPAVAFDACVAFGGVDGPAALDSTAAASPRQWWRHPRAEGERQAVQGQVLEKMWCLCWWLMWEPARRRLW